MSHRAVRQVVAPAQCGRRAAQSEKLFCSAKERAVGSGLRYAASVRGSTAAARPVASLGATPPAPAPDGTRQERSTDSPPALGRCSEVRSPLEAGKRREMAGEVRGGGGNPG